MQEESFDMNIFIFRIRAWFTYTIDKNGEANHIVLLNGIVIVCLLYNSCKNIFCISYLIFAIQSYTCYDNTLLYTSRYNLIKVKPNSLARIGIF